MARTDQHRPKRIAIEVAPSRLSVAVIDEPPGGPRRIRCRSTAWGAEAENVGSPEWIENLAGSLAHLSSQEQIGRQPLTLVLAGAFCVTRVITGPSDRVGPDLNQLEERAKLYVGLGRGKKLVARSILPLDARHQHALLAVASQGVLEAILAAARRAGLRVARVEPALVALARFVAADPQNAVRAALIVRLGEADLELGVALSGRLLLDFRPRGLSSARHAAETIDRHLGRLKRWWSRQPGAQTAPSLDRVYLCGRGEALADGLASFAGHAKLHAVVLRPNLTDGAGGGESDAQGEAGSECCAALGACLAADLDPQARGADSQGPNLLEPLCSERQSIGRPALIRQAWPLAVAALVACCLQTAIGIEQRSISDLSRQMETLEPERQRAWLLRVNAAEAQGMAGFLAELERAAAGASPDLLLPRLAQCLPSDVWLKRIQMQGAGQVLLSGASFSPDGVFEFVRWLSEAPGASAVQLEGTAEAQLNAGQATEFEVRFNFSGHPVPADYNG